MTLLLRVIVLFVVALSVEAAAPVISCTPNITSGTEPLGVVFDCSATTDGDTSKPFHDLLYRTNFGDTNVGTDTWANGANTNASKNIATGPVIAHVYESCVGSPFTVTHYVTDGTSNSQTTNSITVACANDTYNAGNTKCFYQTTASGDCPNGGSEILNADWDSAVSACMGTTKRCLFQRGSTFTAGTSSVISAAGPNTIGAYGTGVLPRVNVNANIRGLELGSAINDLRIMDIDFVGAGNGGTDVGIILGSSASVSGVTVLRVTAREMGGNGIILAVGSAPNLRGVSNTIVQESTLYNNYSGSNLYVRFNSTSAILGNVLGPVGSAGTPEFSLRIARLQKSVIAHNTIQGPGTGKELVALRADTQVTTAEDSFYFVFSDNKGLTGTQNIGVQVQSGTASQFVYDYILERNWITLESYTGAQSCSTFRVSGSRGTLRNNLTILTDPTTCSRHGIQVGRISAEDQPDDIDIYNNTSYSSATATTRGVTILTGATNSIVKNNLCWFDNGTACLLDQGTGTVAATNSSTAQTTGTDPLFDGPTTTPVGFRISTSSYAATGGTALYPSGSDDFLSCSDTTANVHIGAFVPQARSRCRSAPGP